MRTAAHPHRPRSTRHVTQAWRHRATAAAVQALLFGGALGLAVAPMQAWAQQASAETTRKAFNVPAGSLEDALNSFARQAGITLSFDPALVRGKRSPGVGGEHDVLAGFARVLAGSGLQARPSGANSYIVAAQQAATGAHTVQAREASLPVVRVVANAYESPVTEGSGSYAGPSTTASATGLPLSIRDTPQTVNVVTLQQMRDQGTSGIAEVMQNAAGINTQRYDSERWMFSSRGFVITNFMHDGVPRLYDGIYDWGATHLDMVFYDRVEIVKGATGLLSGSGLPSATVNFVRKRPRKEPASSVSVQAGSWDHRRLEGDVSTPLTEDKSVRLRIAGAHQDRGSVMDHYRQKLSALYGIVEAELAPTTRLTLGADGQQVDPRGSSWTGLPVFHSDGSRTQFSRSLNPATEWSRRVFNNRSMFVMLEHQFSSDWRLKAEANQLRSRHRSTLGSASGGYPDPNTGLGMYLFSGQFEGDRTQNTVHASLQGHYPWLGRRHEAAFGATWTDAKTDGATYAGQYPMLTGSIFDWDGRIPEPSFERIGNYGERHRQTGLYASTRLRASDRLALILGARRSQVSLQYREHFIDGRADGSYSLKESQMTPYAGVVYELDGVHALYASYTSIFEPQALRTLAGDFLEPLKGRALEAGVKADYLDGQVQTSLALFQIQQDNLPEYAGYVGDNDERYRGIQGVRSRGLEVQLTGRLTPRWNINASYAYTHVRTADGKPVYGATLMTTEPAQMARLFTSLRLSEGSTGWSLGGGISWQSRFEGKVWPPAADATDYAIVRQKAYALVDLNAQYQFTPKLGLSAVLRNAFNKDYLNSIGLFETAYRGEPRSLLLTLRYSFE